MFYDIMIDGIKNFSFKSALAFNQVQTSPILSQTLSKRGISPQQQNNDVFVKNNTDNKNKLSIYYYNDTHGNSDQMAGLINGAQKFKQEHKDDSTLILSGGDNSSGGDVQKNEFIFDLMENAIQVDASAIGNHEIDGKKEGFKDAIKEKNIPFIATNVEFDDEEFEIKQIYENEYVANAMMRLDEFNEHFNTNLEDEDVETIGGLVVKALGRIAQNKDTIDIENFSFTVLEVDGPRVIKLKIKRNVIEEEQKKEED